MNEKWMKNYISHQALLLFVLGEVPTAHNLR
jgi:hypothetical protein